ncbi:4-hydroxybutyrate--CoA ligase 2 [Rhodovastum atsumiense]|uniref:3-methylmercaptopropionyl-CoA ligase n=1 Tax=Rhodovastum atsumiense TaxID=504468 RepID=A0A5M6IXV8_9PROT|nr:acyl-CoA synthetase [Rhodovastum atsumiense]KAA5613190.1 acyl-CoA synthetase [Rhodovastum atsumiense]CAH2600658.1 4-hydroxybutyrate--CoA ligase 2 [Rhodovastum atsumiense]
MPSSIYDQDLDQNPANYVPLTPISFLSRAARVFPNGIAIIHGDRRITYTQMLERCRRFASALARHGIGRGDTVSVLAPNTPAMLEAHYAVPMTGGVLCTINTRLDAPIVAFILEHSETRIFLVDRELAPVAKAALALVKGEKPLVIGIDDALTTAGELLGEIEYEDFVASGDPDFPVSYPGNEWDAISLGYTSGTTGDPKGVVCHHRGAYLNAIGNAFAFGITPRSVYLWTLPMFHCNGWTFTWAITMLGGTHVCLRRVDPALIYPLIVEHKVTHMCAAPVVLTMLIHAPETVRRDFGGRTVNIATGGAAPPSAVIESMEKLGFTMHHVYGLTEVYGPLTYCIWQPGHEDLPLTERAHFLSRQGVPHPTAEDATIMDVTMNPMRADGKTIGELMLRGNTVMKGYLKNPKATQASFAGGWFHSGDLGVRHPDSYLEIKDRSKDIIISGGENISSLEVEEVLYRHPDIMEAAVVAHPDEKWGEVPHAFVTPKPGAEDTLTAADVIAYCRANLAGFKTPRHVSFVQLPKTSTGKIQKFELRRRLAEGLKPD